MWLQLPIKKSHCIPFKKNHEYIYSCTEAISPRRRQMIEIKQTFVVSRQHFLAIVMRVGYDTDT